MNINMSAAWARLPKARMLARRLTSWFCLPPLKQASTDAANRFLQVGLAWELACRSDEPQRLCLFRP